MKIHIPKRGLRNPCCIQYIIVKVIFIHFSRYFFMYPDEKIDEPLYLSIYLQHKRVCTYTHTHTHTHTHINQTHTHTCDYNNMFCGHVTVCNVYMYICIYVYIYRYIYLYIRRLY